MPDILILMGSDSDAPVMQAAVDVLRELEITAEMTVASAHRSPDRVIRLVREAPGRGVKVFIVGAGAAAHLGGVVAAHTTLPVIGVPIDSSALNGLDALPLDGTQMPPGVPVATVSIGGPGAPPRACSRPRSGALRPGAGRAIRCLQDAARRASRNRPRRASAEHSEPDRPVTPCATPSSPSAAAPTRPTRCAWRRRSAPAARKNRRPPMPTSSSSIPARSPRPPIRSAPDHPPHRPRKPGGSHRRDRLLCHAQPVRPGRARRRTADRAERRQGLDRRRTPGGDGRGPAAAHPRRRRSVRRLDRTGRRRPHRFHAARADRMRRTLLVLHHPLDSRRRPEPWHRRRGRRGQAGDEQRLQGSRAHGGPSRLVRPRSRAAPVAAGLCALADPAGRDVPHQFARAGLHAGDRIWSQSAGSPALPRRSSTRGCCAGTDVSYTLAGYRVWSTRFESAA